jgi:hypothetical protein
MDPVVEQFIRHLQADIDEWKKDVEFFTKNVRSVELAGEKPQTGKEFAQRFHFRIKEHQDLINKLKAEARTAR